MKTISPGQEAVLNFITDYIGEFRFPPTFREIGDGCGIKSTSHVGYNLRALERKGYIRTWPEKARAIEVLKQ